MSRSDISSTAVSIITQKTRSDAYWTFEVITTGETTYRWSKRTLASAWDGNAYSYKILSHSSIVQRRGQSEGGIQAASDFTFVIDNKGNVITASDLKGASVKASYVVTATVSGVSKTDVICSFIFRVLRAIPKEQTIEIVCKDWLQSYLKGFYPNGNLMNDAFPSDNIQTEDLCEPLVIGDDAYIPLPAIVSGEEIYYVLGKSDGTTYTIEEFSNPKEWGKRATYGSDSSGGLYEFDQSDLEGEDGETYRVVQPLCVDADNDGEYENTFFHIGKKLLPFPCAFTRDDTSTKTNPADVLDYVLQGFGIASGRIGSVSKAAAETIYDDWSLAFRLGLWFRIPRKKLLARLCAECHTDLVPVGHALGSELVTNGNFTDWTGDDPDDWTLLEAEDGNNYVTENSGKCRIVSDGSPMGVYQNILTEGKLYKYSINITNITSGSIYLGYPQYVGFNTTGVKTGYFTAGSTQFRIARGGACDVTFDDVSVKEVTEGAIAFKPLTVTSQLSITKDMVLPNGFGKPRSLIQEEQNDSLYVAWQESGKPTDSLFKSRIPAKSSTDNPSGETLDLPDIPNSQNVQKAGQLAAQLLLLPEYEVTLHCKDEVLQVEPGDWVTIPHSDYGGSFVALVDSMDIQEYGSVKITVIKFSDTLDDWTDLSPSAITVEEDTVAGGYNLVRCVEVDNEGEIVSNIGDKLNIGDTTADNYVSWDGTTLTVRGSLNADDIVAGTLTSRTVQTASSGKRIVASADDNELHFYGDRGDTTIEELATIGISTVGADQVIGQFGTSNSTRIAVFAKSNSGAAMYAESSSSYGIYALSDSGMAVVGVSTSDLGVYGFSISGVGVKGISGSNYAIHGDGGSNVGGYFEGGSGPICLKPSSSASAPTGSAAKGTLWVTSAGVLYINTDGSTTWAKVGAQ